MCSHGAVVTMPICCPSLEHADEAPASPSPNSATQMSRALSLLSEQAHPALGPANGHPSVQATSSLVLVTSSHLSALLMAVDALTQMALDLPGTERGSREIPDPSDLPNGK